MADLKTAIGADDSDFQRGVDRVNARLNGLVRTTDHVRRGFGQLRNVFAGFGALGVASQIVQLSKELEEMSTRGQKLKVTLSEIAIEATKAANQEIRALRGESADSRADVFAKRAESLQKLNDTALEYEQSLRSMSFLDRLKFYQANTEDRGLIPSWGELLTGPLGNYRYGRRIYAGMDSVRERAIADQWETVRAGESTVTQGTERQAEALAKKQALDLAKAKVAEIEKDVAESAKSWDEWFAAQEKFNRERDEETARLKELLGDSKGADLMRLQSKTRDRIREIENSDLLTLDAKRGLIGFYRNQSAYEAASINSRYMAEDEMRKQIESRNVAYHSLSGSVGGATFAQQLAMLAQPAERPLEQMKDIQERILKELIARLPPPGGTISATYGY
ncbi:MAG: hypothetical protein KF691_07435 [Phycisphaeraceae bacterium]|nr:hypothetical protein [Phycisphaeraceae bacterium]